MSRETWSYLTPDFSRLWDPLVWAAAFGQAFFSLGVGTGIMLTYGSYMEAGSIPRTAALITGADLLVALLGGLVVFPIVFSHGADPAAGVELAFVTLPRIFEDMPLGYPLGAAFFLLLAVAAFTSAVSILELPVATLVDAYDVSRKWATAGVTATVMALGVPAALSYSSLRWQALGVPLLDLQDYAFGTVGMVVAGLILSVSAGWFLAPRAVLDEIGGSRWSQRLFMAIVKVLVPLALTSNLIARALTRA